ncbi:MAG: helix-turn-helix domain-containing protein [Candidatus Dormibacteria bacterium]|jgi:excisionase family DNA binding protein|nr:excisionase [Chloroflexota bacterium]
MSAAAELAPPPALLTLDLAARYLSVSRRHLERLVVAGELPVVRLGRAVRVAVVDLDDLIGRRTDGPMMSGGGGVSR